MWSQKKSHLVLSKQQQNSLTWKLRQQIDLESRSNVGDSPNRHLGEGRKPRTPISSSIQNVNHPSFIRILYILSISFEGEWTQKLGSFSILGPVFRAHFQTLGINQWECLDCPNPWYGPKGFIMRVGPLLLKLTWRVTWRCFGGKEMGRSQKNWVDHLGWRPTSHLRPTSPNLTSGVATSLPQKALRRHYAPTAHFHPFKQLWVS